MPSVGTTTTGSHQIAWEPAELSGRASSRDFPEKPQEHGCIGHMAADSALLALKAVQDAALIIFSLPCA